MSEENDVPEEAGLSTEVGDEATESSPEMDDDELVLKEDAYYISLHLYDQDKLRELIINRGKRIGSSEVWADNVNKLGSYDHVLATRVKDTEMSDEEVRMQEAIEKIEDKSKFTTYLADENGKPILAVSNRKFKPSQKGKSLKGKDAVMAVMQAGTSGSQKKIGLYNSGFHVDIANPPLAEIDKFITMARSDAKEYGRIFGSVYFLMEDALIKRAWLDVYLNQIAKSSLKNWNSKEVMLRSIKLPDLHHLIWGFANYLYPEGFDNFRHACTNIDAGCTHTEVGTVDLIKMCRHNYSLMNSDAVAHMAKSQSDGVITSDDLQTYQKYLGFDGSAEENRNTIRVGRRGFVLKVPSLYDYITSSDRFIALLRADMYSNDLNQAMNASYSRAYRQLAPWIKEIVIYDSEDENAEIINKVTVAIDIEDSMNYIQTEDVDLVIYKEIEKYINEVQISHVCYPIYPCPKCGHVPSDVPSGFMTVDPLRTFFTLSVCRSRVGYIKRESHLNKD